MSIKSNKINAQANLPKDLQGGGENPWIDSESIWTSKPVPLTIGSATSTNVEITGHGLTSDDEIALYNATENDIIPVVVTDANNINISASTLTLAPTAAGIHKKFTTQVSAESAENRVINRANNEFIAIDDSTLGDGTNIVSDTELIENQNWTIEGVDAKIGTVSSVTTGSHLVYEDIGVRLGLEGKVLTHTDATSAWDGSNGYSFLQESGDIYFEVELTTQSNSFMIGFSTNNTEQTTFVGGTAAGYQVYSVDGSKRNNSSVAYMSPFGQGDIIGCRYEYATGEIEFFKWNGTTMVSQGIAWTITPNTKLYIATSIVGTGDSATLRTNDSELADKPIGTDNVEVQSTLYTALTPNHLHTTKPTQAYRKGGETLSAVLNNTVPTMTSDSLPSGTCFRDGSWGGFEAYKAFDGNNSTYTKNGSLPYRVGYINTAQRTVSKVNIVAQSVDGSLGYPEDFTIELSNDTTTGLDGTWTTAKTVTGYTNWSGVQSFNLDVVGSYTACRINTTVTTNGNNGAIIDTIELLNSTSTPTTFSGTNPISGLLATGDVIENFEGVEIECTNVVESIGQIGAPNDEFGTALYTGNGSTQTVSVPGISTGVDFAWIKARSTAATARIHDSLSVDSNYLIPSSINTEASNGELTGLGSSSFDLTWVSSNSWNASGQSYVAWCASLPNHTPANTDGTITSEVKANSFMSAISYTGTGVNATVGHGLGKAPELVLYKNRTFAQSWFVYSSAVGATSAMFLDESVATVSTTAFNNATPTSSVLSIGANTGAGSTDDFIAYAFTSVSGKCKIGSYTGTGSAGNSISTAVDGGDEFEPQWIMIKRTDGTGNWVILDSTRDQDGIQDTHLYADASQAELANDVLDVVFNPSGLTVDGTASNINASGGTYIFMAITKDTSTDTNQYDCTFAAQAQAHSGDAKVPNRVTSETVESEVYNGTDVVSTMNIVSTDYKGNAMAAMSKQHSIIAKDIDVEVSLVQSNLNKQP